MNAWDFRSAYGLPSPGFTLRIVTRDSVGSNAAVIGDSVGESSKDEFTTITNGMFPSLTVAGSSPRLHRHRVGSRSPPDFR